jgi:RHS repeat-associated protein
VLRSSAAIVGALRAFLTYDVLGNLTSKSDSGVITHAASNSWYSFQLPKLINTTDGSGSSSEFFYSPDRARYRQEASYGGTPESTFYIGGLMEKVSLGGVTSFKHYIVGGSGIAALYTRKDTGANEVHYLTHDPLGSIDSVTGSTGTIEVRLSYSAFGQRRNEASWSGNPTPADWAGITATTRFGFTGQEMLDNLNLIHMNGRAYDPLIGRFTSVDPIVDGALNTQGWNAYAYVKNNPLSFIDPSGWQEAGTGEGEIPPTSRPPDSCFIFCAGLWHFYPATRHPLYFAHALRGGPKTVPVQSVPEDFSAPRESDLNADDIARLLADAAKQASIAARGIEATAQALALTGKDRIAVIARRSANLAKVLVKKIEPANIILDGTQVVVLSGQGQFRDATIHAITMQQRIVGAGVGTELGMATGEYAPGAVPVLATLGFMSPDSKIIQRANEAGAGRLAGITETALEASTRLPGGFQPGPGNSSLAMACSVFVYVACGLN